MKNENIASIIELIESGNDIYNKAIEHCAVRNCNLS